MPNASEWKDSLGRFKKGHPLINGINYKRRTVNPKGYVRILDWNHPQHDSKGYVSEHLVVCEKALGKKLPSKAVVHHHDRNPSNNTNSNLVICQDQAYHRYLHQRARAYYATGNPRMRSCSYCKIWFLPTRKQRVCKSCAAEVSRNRNPEKRRLYSLEYRRKNKETINEKRRLWRAKNRLQG